MRIFLFLLSLHIVALFGVEVGVDRVFLPPFNSLLKDKKIGLITNQTGVNKELTSTVDLFFQRQKFHGFELKALFAPEHGLYGDFYAGDHVPNAKYKNSIPIHSLHGSTRRPTDEMLKGITLLVFDIQDIGSRSYTFTSTLYYCMEEAAKRKIPVMVLDRPNPINGLCVDGPMLENEFRSFLGYVNVPYCHGMTAGELARFFNAEYSVGCMLYVVPMRGWNRAMSFEETKLSWIPTSPNIPEASTSIFYPTTGLLGEMPLASIGIGYTLPFRVVGAPWIDAEAFTKSLNRYNLPGVRFQRTYFRPYFGRFAQKPCQGALIVVTNKRTFLPITTQYLILSVLKELYPDQTNEALKTLQKTPQNFYKVCGTKAIHQILQKEPKPFSKLSVFHKSEREAFLPIRKKYLLPEYE